MTAPSSTETNSIVVPVLILVVTAIVVFFIVYRGGRNAKGTMLNEQDQAIKGEIIASRIVAIVADDNDRLLVKNLLDEHGKIRHAYDLYSLRCEISVKIKHLNDQTNDLKTSSRIVKIEDAIRYLPKEAHVLSGVIHENERASYSMPFRELSSPLRAVLTDPPYGRTVGWNQ